jgi:uncharacterized protein
MTRFFVDTVVLAYSVGEDHADRQACRDLLQAASAGRIELHASVEAVQEFLFHRLRRGERSLATAMARRMADLCVLHPLDRSVATRMIDLLESTSLQGRDAVHVATAQLAGFASIVSADRDFDAAPDLSRLTPQQAAASV